MRKHIVQCFITTLVLTTILECQGKRGPCPVRTIPHDQDMLDTLFEAVDYTEKDILPSEYAGVEEGPFVEGDIIPSASNVHYHDLGLRWPNATVPFVFHNMMSYQGRAQVLRAMNEYHRHTCIQFKKRHGERDYLVIGSSYQVICASSVGRQGGAQLLHLGPACLRSLGTPLHELMHALGFFHEHMRPDRNRYVHINYSNIDEPLWKNFRAVYPGTEMWELGAGYDFGSLMHYRLCAMTNNSWPTIVPKINPKVEVIGQRRGFSEKDIIKINNFYNCSSVLRAPKMLPVDSTTRTQNNRNSKTTPSSSMLTKPTIICFKVVIVVILYYECTRTCFVQYKYCLT